MTKRAYAKKKKGKRKRHAYKRLSLTSLIVVNVCSVLSKPVVMKWRCGICKNSSHSALYFYLSAQDCTHKCRFFSLLSTLCHSNSLKDKLEAARVLFSSFDRLQMRALVIVTFDPHSGYIHATPALFDDFCRLFCAHRYESRTDSRGIRRIRKTFCCVLV